MSNDGRLTKRIFVYYKILNAGSLKSSSESQCLYSCTHIFDNTCKKLDSSDSEFMCTIIDSKNTLYVADILHLLDNSLDSSKYVTFAKVLVPLEHFYPHPVNLQPLNELCVSNDSNSEHDDIGYDYNVATSPYKNKDDEYNLNQYDTELCAKRFFIFTLSKNLNLDTLMNNSDPPKQPEKKKSNLVWVPVQLDDPIVTFENKIYIKLYLSTKPKKPARSQKVSTRNLVNTTASHHGVLFKEINVDQRSEEKQFKSAISKSASLLNQPLLPSDRDEIAKRISDWSITRDGKLKDIRSLLSTLQHVLLVEIEWEPMPISMLVGDKNAIKKYYKKALLTFHPDKLKFKTAKTRLFSELLIQTLIKSWNISQ